MAEAYLRKYAGDTFQAYSAGLEPKGIHPLTIKVLEEKGFDLSEQRSKDVMEYMGILHFAYLITVCAQAEDRCPRTFPGVGERLYWDLEDPAAFVGTEEETLAKFREIRDQVDSRIVDWLHEIGVSAQPQAT